MRSPLVRRTLACAAGLAFAIAIVMHSIGLESIAEACGTAAFFILLGTTLVCREDQAEEST
jgi:hypothetical protein